MLRWVAEVLLLVLGTSGTLGDPTSVPSNVNPTLVQNVYLALEKMLEFFSQDYSSINLDGLFGLRLGQGQLMLALDECEKNVCDRNLLMLLTNLVPKVEDICSKALLYVEQNDPIYYKRFEDLVAKPYILPYNSTILHPSPGLHLGFKINYDEERGDACYSRILGTFVQDNNLLPKCNITADCMAYMTQDETAMYFLTHQLLYFIVAENVGCIEAMQKLIGSQRILDIERHLCEKIYTEAKSYVKNGDVDESRRDLFLEQVDLCGSLGFENFMKTDWIRMILRWPDWREGCFKSNLKPVAEIVDEEINTLEKDEGHTLAPGNVREFQHKREVEYEKESQTTFRGNKGSMRKLLREKPMRDGCLSHTSGLGFGAFGLFLRYLQRHLYNRSNVLLRNCCLY